MNLTKLERVGKGYEEDGMTLIYVGRINADDPIGKTAFAIGMEHVFWRMPILPLDHYVEESDFNEFNNRVENETNQS